MRLIGALSLAVIGLTWMTWPSQAQNINSIQTRLDRMEREMQTLSRSIYKGDVPPPQFSGQVDHQAHALNEQRLSQLEDQLRRLTGMIEETGYRLRQLEGQVKTQSAVSTVQTQDQMPNSLVTDDVISDIKAQEVDTKPSDNIGQPYQLGTITNNSQVATPSSVYDKAFSLMQTNDYASAQAGFEDFIARYPDHSLAANSKYWLGETFYARGDFQSASRAFARSFKDHPEGQKAPDTLLKLAMSLKAQDMTDEACLTLSELMNRFSEAPASVLAKADEEKTSYSCP